MEERRKLYCVEKDGGRWGQVREGWGEQCIYPRDEEWAKCMGSSDQAEFDWDTKTCYATWEEMEVARKDNCIKDGGEWRALQEGWGEECYIKGEDAWKDCKVSGTDGQIMEYDWDTKKCYDAKTYCEEVQGQKWNDEWKYCEWVKDMDMEKEATAKLYRRMMRNLA